MDSTRRRTPVDIPLNATSIGDWNVRHSDIAAGLSDLAASLDKYGQLQPIMVIEKANKYEIVIGQRRYLAAKQLEWETISATILPPDTSKREATVLSFIENSQRVEIPALDKERTCKFLLDELGSVAAVAKELGCSVVTVRKWLSFSTVPDKLKEMVKPGGITRDQAIRLSRHIDDESKVVEIAERMAEIKPAKNDRERIIQAVEEVPTSSVGSIFDRAEEMKEQKDIHFILVSREKELMEMAEDRFEQDGSDLAKEATVEWLKLIEY